VTVENKRYKIANGNSNGIYSERKKTSFHGLKSDWV
jgi:hypothetical protein